MNREGLDKFFERTILGLVLAILVFAPLAMGAVDAWAFLVVQGLTVAVMLVWVLRLWFSPRPQLLWPPLGWVVLAFAIYAVARYLTADIEYVARPEMIQVVMYAFLFFAIVNNLYRQESVQIVSFTLVFLAMGISGYAVAQLLTHSNHVWNLISPYSGRASGTYISPNNLAGFLEMLLPVAVAYLLVGRMNAVLRILLGYAALIIAAGLAVTFSRGGWVAAAVGLLALLLTLIGHRNHRWRALLLLFIMLGGGAVFVTQYLSRTVGFMRRVEKVESGDTFSLDVRFDIWRAAERMWLDHFWWGVGPAHYDYRFREYRPDNVQMRPDRAHNDYLNLLADWGAAGGLMVLAGAGIFAAGLAKTWRHVRRAEKDFGSGQSNRFAFFLGAAAGLLALAVHSAADFNLHIPANALVGVTLLALLSSNLRFATERYWLVARLPVRMLLTVALAGGVVYLTGQAWRRGHEACWLARAARFPDYFSTQHTAALEKAFAAEPMNFQTAYDIGEAYRVESFNGGDHYADQAEKAMQWYARARQLDRYDAYSYLRQGMCLDWLDRHEQAGNCFSQAEALDPNGYYTVAIVGWHYVQIGDYAAAKPWFERSLRLGGGNIGRSYLDLVEQKLLARASGKSAFPADF
ncbi:MAG TPA: O-antigen ligase family protein [Verrucomicrobiae bacterium]|nr:O-antigen ligase family protein [Verrucomicrobiae bacterium]